jgi:hypothetical protein
MVAGLLSPASARSAVAVWVMHLVQQTIRSVCSTLNHHDSFEQFPGRNSPRNSSMFIRLETKFTCFVA